MKRKLQYGLIGLASMATAAAWASPPQSATPQLIRVTLGGKIQQAESGRLLLFAIPKALADAQAKGHKIESVDTSPFEPDKVAVAAQEVHHLLPGGSVVVEDLDSTNGTFVNGSRVGRSELRPGDHLRLGDLRLLID